MATQSVDRSPLGKDASTQRRIAKVRRHARLRKLIAGTADRPRLAVYRSARHIHAQVIDDTKGHTLVSASSVEADVQAISGTKTDKSTKVGELIAKRAKVVGISSVVFDRGGNKYHGRIAALADGARKAGLDF